MEEPLRSKLEYYDRVVNGPPFPKDDEMKFEEFRKGSFLSWDRPAHFDTPAIDLLASVGFFYTGFGKTDNVQCFGCKGCFLKWNTLENLIQKHGEVCPKCPFLQDQDEEGELSENHQQSYVVPTADSPESVENLLFPFANCQDTQDRGCDGNQNDTTCEEGTNEVDSASSVTSSRGQVKHVKPRFGLPVQATGEGTAACKAYVENPYQLPVVQNRYISPENTATNLQQLPGPYHVQEPQPRSGIHRDSASRHSQPTTNRESLPPSWPLGLTQPEYAPVTHHPTPEPRLLGSEAGRESTFQRWSSWAFQHPSTLAAAGFYHSGEGDQTCCPFCHLVVNNWQAEDVPLVKHLQLSPACPYARQEYNWSMSSAAGTVGPSGQDHSTVSSGQTYADVVNGNQVASTHHSGDNGALSGPPNPQPTSLQHPAQSQGPRQESQPGVHPQYMENSAVRKAMEMGFQYEYIRKIVECQLRQGNGSIHAEALLNALLDASAGVEENTRVENESSLIDTGCNTGPAAPEGSMEEAGSLEALKQENQQLKQQDLCKLCLVSPACLLFIPCGHMLSCWGCSANLTECSVCNTPIQRKLQVYKS